MNELLVDQLWPDGAVVIQTEDGLWDGRGGFVDGWGAAKKYRPCTDDHLAGEAEVMRETGKRSWTVYIQPSAALAS